MGGCVCRASNWKQKEDVTRTMTIHSNSSDGRIQQILSSCPSLKVPYSPPWWCLNCWINVGAMFKRQGTDETNCPELQRDLLKRPDGGEVSVDWYEADGLPSNAPVLGILHAVTGNSRQYAGFMRYAKNRGWRCCVLNRRGHSEMPLRTPVFGVLGDSDDTVAMANHIRAAHPKSFIAFAGISAGGGAIVNYIGREGKSVAIDAAAALCPCWDLRMAFKYLLDRYPWWDNYMLNLIKKFFLSEPKNQDALAKLPDAVSAALEASTCDEFIQSAFPLAGCSNLDEFFEKNNPMQYAMENTTPCLALHALDDFLCVKENIEFQLAENHKNYLLLVTQEGSHISYTESSECGNYMWRVTMDFFEAARGCKTMEDSKQTSGS